MAPGREGLIVRGIRGCGVHTVRIQSERKKRLLRTDWKGSMEEEEQVSAHRGNRFIVRGITGCSAYILRK